MVLGFLERSLWLMQGWRFARADVLGRFQGVEQSCRNFLVALIAGGFREHVQHAHIHD